MPQNFLACDRELERLLPPSLRDWLPEDHFAWFVIDAVAALDLAAFWPAIGRSVGVARRTITPQSRGSGSGTNARWVSCSGRCCDCADAGLMRVAVLAVDG